MKYLIRYYLNGDKTRFYNTNVEIKNSQELAAKLQEFFYSHESATIQKIVKQ